LHFGAPSKFDAQLARVVNRSLQQILDLLFQTNMFNVQVLKFGREDGTGSYPGDGRACASTAVQAARPCTDRRELESVVSTSCST